MPRSPIPLPGYLLLVAAVWIGLMLLLLTLQLLGAGMGLRVWPLGEDRIWLRWLQSYPPIAVPHAMWISEGRNPLVAWWYVVASPVIQSSEYGLYAVRRMVDAVGALAVFLLVWQFGRGHHRLFAFSCALLVLLWNFSYSYFSSLLWAPLTASVLTVLSIWSYCRYIDGQRQQSLYLPMSLLLYLASLSTYSFQAAAFVAVFILAIFRPSARPTDLRCWLRRLALAAADTSCYLVMLTIFAMMWITTTNMAIDGQNSLLKLDYRLVSKQLLMSMQSLLWHGDYTGLLHSLVSQWNLTVVVLVGLSAVLAFSLLLLVIVRDEKSAGPGTANSVAPLPLSAAATSLLATVSFTLVVALALALPTLIVESTSIVWFPGARSVMIQQIFQPLLYVSLIFLVVDVVRRFHDAAAGALAIFAVAVVCSAALMVSLEYNRVLTLLTANEQVLVRGLRQLIPTINDNTLILVKLDGVSLPGWHILSTIYAQTYWNTPLVALRVIAPTGLPADPTNKETVILGKDEQGVYTNTLLENYAWHPYSQVVFARYDSSGVSLMDVVGSEEFLGYPVAFQRDGALDATARDGTTLNGPCFADVDFNTLVRGYGWSVPERSPSGETFQWTDAIDSAVYLDLARTQDITLQFRVISAMAPDILESLRLVVDQEAIALNTIIDGNATLFEATVPRSVLARRVGPIEVRFTVNRTIMPPGGTRTLGIAFDFLRVTKGCVPISR